MMNQVKFVVCERLHEGGEPITSLLIKYGNNGEQQFIFADGDPDCFDPKEILMFDQYEAAETIVNLAWDLNQVYLGVAIWESMYPNEVDYTYVTHGKEKNLQVKKTREDV